MSLLDAMAVDADTAVPNITRGAMPGDAYLSGPEVFPAARHCLIFRDEARRLVVVQIWSTVTQRRHGLWIDFRPLPPRMLRRARRHSSIYSSEIAITYAHARCQSSAPLMSV